MPRTKRNKPKSHPLSEERAVLCVPLSQRTVDLIGSLDILYGENNSEKAEFIIRKWLSENHPEMTLPPLLD